MDVSENLKRSVIDHWELLCTLCVVFALHLAWADKTYASNEDVNKALKPLEAQLEELVTNVEKNGSAIAGLESGLTQVEIQIQRSSLQQERRELNRNIREIENAISDGLASEREEMGLPGLYSDLQDIEDEISRLDNE